MSGQKKALYIAEKPSVAREFARVLKIGGRQQDGYLESDDSIVTWCVGHLVTMSYPEKYDMQLKRWSFETLPFLPENFLYEVIPSVRRQFDTVAGLLNREDVQTIYVCTDSGREGEYIYRLVAMMAKVGNKDQRRVWIDSQTEEEILRGIREAKSLSAYDHLSDAAFLRAKEDYLMGINFSRALSLRHGREVAAFLKKDHQAIAVGRVMTCVLGMVVRREREIRSFVKTPFYRVTADFALEGETFEGEWRAVEGSRYFRSPLLYRENGFREKKDAVRLIRELTDGLPGIAGELQPPQERVPVSGTREDDEALPGPLPEGFLRATVVLAEKKKEKKNPPLLFNLAELQNVCAKLFKISPDETLQIAQELYEKKLCTYPRTDARVLSSAVAKEISRNIGGLKGYPVCGAQAAEVLEGGSWKSIAKTRYTNDSQITDHYAIIPTGQGLGALSGLSLTSQRVYEIIVRRFLCIFYPPAVYQKVSLTAQIGTEKFFSSFKVLLEEGYLKIARASFASKKDGTGGRTDSRDQGQDPSGSGNDVPGNNDDMDMSCDEKLLAALQKLRKGSTLPVSELFIKEGETTPPKRYNSGSMILAMENAGQLIEDEELRSQIRSSGIGTSATRAEILKKLVKIEYLNLNQKTQIITPTLLGEMIYDVVYVSIRSLLNPELTASWEKGLTGVADGSITPEEYMSKLRSFVSGHTRQVRDSRNTPYLTRCFAASAACYPATGKGERRKSAGSAGKSRSSK